MSASRIMPVWQYHAARQRRAASTWVVVTLVGFLAVTQGVVTEHTPALMKNFAGPEMAQVISAAMPEPSWQQAYTGWLKNLSQILTLSIIAVNAISSAELIKNGDIPFVLTKNVRRSVYLITATLTTWSLMLFLGLLGALLTWAGVKPLFPTAPLTPVLLATIVWAVEVTLIHACQMVAATWRRGLGAPLIAGLGVYFFISIAGMWEKLSHYTPLGLTSLSKQLSQQTSGTHWFWPLCTSLLLAVALLVLSVHRFNRIELA